MALHHTLRLLTTTYWNKQTHIFTNSAHYGFFILDFQTYTLPSMLLCIAQLGACTLSSLPLCLLLLLLGTFVASRQLQMWSPLTDRVYTLPFPPGSSFPYLPFLFLPPVKPLPSPLWSIKAVLQHYLAPLPYLPLLWSLILLEVWHTSSSLDKSMPLIFVSIVNLTRRGNARVLVWALVHSASSKSSLSPGNAFNPPTGWRYKDSRLVNCHVYIQGTSSAGDFCQSCTWRIFLAVGGSLGCSWFRKQLSTTGWPPQSAT